MNLKFKITLMIDALNLNKHIQYINARSNNLITTKCALKL